jgi:malyl-CoA/(S)-citramalyl-CoA lyase
MRPARQFHQPLAIGAPLPMTSQPPRLERLIHFFPPHVEKVRSRIGALIPRVDVLLGNLEDAVPAEEKVAARRGLIEVARAHDFGHTGLWVRSNTLDSPWGLDDLLELVREIGDRLDVVMLPKVEGPWDIHFVDQLLAQLEAKYRLQRPILVHAIIETAQGVANVERIAACSPRLHGMSIGPADLAASRGMKLTRVGGGHPDYRVLEDETPGQPRRGHQQDLWHYTVAKIVDACASNGLKAFYGPFADFEDPLACESQFRNAFLLGCAGAWSLHPSQIEIAKRVFAPDDKEVRMARRIVEAMAHGSGAAMVDGKMQDDATLKQARVILALADAVAARDPESAQRDAAA